MSSALRLRRRNEVTDVDDRELYTLDAELGGRALGAMLTENSAVGAAAIRLRTEAAGPNGCIGRACVILGNLYGPGKNEPDEEDPEMRVYIITRYEEKEDKVIMDLIGSKVDTEWWVTKELVELV